MRAQDTDRDSPDWAPDLALWRQCREAVATEDEAARFIDLAGFADERLDQDEAERVAARLAGDPVAAADVAAARAQAATGAPIDAGEHIIARAAALIDASAATGEIIEFRPRRRVAAGWQGFARWGSLAAAIAVASWLGFNLGSDASVAFGPSGHNGDDVSLGEMLDPGAAGLGDFTDRSRT
jgi:anti-sigma factor RsiW